MVTTTSDPDVLTQFLATRSPALREKVVLGYISLVHFVLGRLGVSPSVGVEYDDLVNQGLMGLIEAVDRFDPSHGTQFSTYATVRVRGKVLDYMRSLDWLSRTARQRTRAVQQAINKLYETSQQIPSDAQVADYLGLDLPKVQQAMVDASHVIVSLDALVDIDEDTQLSLHETLPDEDQRDPSDIVDENDLKARLVQVLRQLPEREQLVLSLYYYEELTLKEIGLVLGVSESRVCQLHARAVMALKAILLQNERPAPVESAPPRGGASARTAGSRLPDDRARESSTRLWSQPSTPGEKRTPAWEMLSPVQADLSPGTAPSGQTVQTCPGDKAQSRGQTNRLLVASYGSNGSDGVMHV